MSQASHASDCIRLLAHSSPAHPENIEHWEPLINDGSGKTGHLENVTRLCAAYVSTTFHVLDNGVGAWEALGRLTGRWHELGKFSCDFQNYLRGFANTGEDAHTSEMRGKVDHTSAGAQHAVKTLPPGIGVLLAYPIAGHHAGLLDGLANGPCLKHRLSKEIPDWRSQAPADLLQAPQLQALQLPPDPFAVAFATRMLFMTAAESPLTRGCELKPGARRQTSPVMCLPTRRVWIEAMCTVPCAQIAIFTVFVTTTTW